MNWFKNLNIRLKLLISFLSIAAITATVGIIGIIQLFNANDSDTFLYEKNTVPLGIVTEIVSEFQRHRSDVLLTIINVDNPNIAQNYKTKCEERENSLNELFPKYEDTFIDENDAKQFNEFKELYMKYKESAHEAIALALNEGETNGRKYFDTDLNNARNKVQAALQKIGDLNVQSAKKRSEQNTIQANKAQIILTTIMVLGVLLAALFGWWLSGYVAKAVNAVKNGMIQLETVCMNNLGNGLNGLSLGDLSYNVEKTTKELVISTKDEIGEMALVFNRMLKKAHSGIDAYEIVRENIGMLTGELNLLIDDSKIGKLETRGNSQKFEGVYKVIVEGFNETLDTIIKTIKEYENIIEKIGNGDLTARMIGNYKGSYKNLQDNANKFAESLENLISNVHEAIRATASAGTQISASTEEMAAGAQEQSTQASEVACAVEQMTKTIFETSKNSVKATSAAKNAGLIAKEGGEVVTKTIEGMNRVAIVVNQSASMVQTLGKSSDAIGEIVQVIDDIADQTNLLALNAAIEAARAGEQGRGFAVVADEVRKLAERTTKATKEIAVMIRKIQNDTEGAVISMNKGKEEVEDGKLLADKAGESLKQIIKSSQEVVDLVTQVAAASEEQSASAEQISQSIEGISNVTQESAAGTQQIARAAEDLSMLTGNLEELISQFRINETRNLLTNNNTTNFLN